VVILDTAPSGQQVKELKSWPGRKNTPVRTTIDPRLQGAADHAVVSSRPVALVAVQASTGEIRAVSTNDLNQEKDALAGKYPAGTTFSIIAAESLLKGGFDPRQKVPCTADRSVGGARFQQAGFLGGTATPTFATDFAQGCVTALASLARRVNGPALMADAARFGIGGQWSLPLSTYSGSVPAPDGDAAVARIIAGQSVRVSPLSMALVAGTVASGTWHPPVLVTSPASPDPSVDSPPRVTLAPSPLDAGTLAKLRDLMRAGVTSGTAGAAATSGEPVYGVASGVAYMEKKQRKNLSWFVGWQGDLAIAVMVESTDPTSAAGVAGAFFQNVRAGR
jgi:cell division protein FtsI/penicillin-binding protein 2